MVALVVIAIGIIVVLWLRSAMKQAEAKVDVETPLRRGRIMLWLRQLENADAALTQAGLAGSHPRAPVVLAYQSLLARMQGDGLDAAALALKSMRKDSHCFEAHAAMCLAQLTNKDLVGAFESYSVSEALTPSDVEGHLLRLELFLLFVEMITNSPETADGVTLQHKMTPLVTGTVRLLDGYPELAVSDFRQDGSWFGTVGQGIAEYRFGSNNRAIELWQYALESPAVGNRRVIDSLRFIVEHAERDAQGDATE